MFRKNVVAQFIGQGRRIVAVRFIRQIVTQFTMQRVMSVVAQFIERRKIFTGRYFIMQKVISLVLVAGLVLGSFSGCAKKEPDVIKIGAILPLTGPIALIGEWARNGLQIGVNEINETGGINGKPVEVVIQDCLGDPKIAISVFNKMVNEKIKCIFTTGSSVSLALVPLAEKNKVMLICHASHPGITGSSKYAFRHSNVADDESKILIQFLKEKIKSQKITIIVMNDDYGIAFKNECMRQADDTGIDVIDIVEYDKNQTEFRSIVTKLLEKKPETIILAGLGKGLGILIKTIREQKFTGDLLSTSGFAITDAPAAAGNAAKGLYYCDFILNKEQTSYKNFASVYEKRFKKNSSVGPLLYYNSLMLIRKCIENTGYNSEKISEYLRGINLFTFAGEEMKISKKGDIIPRMVVVQY